jgi:thioredoxin-like negative regulator of GroEL
MASTRKPSGPRTYSYLGPAGTFTEAALAQVPEAKGATWRPVTNVGEALDDVTPNEDHLELGSRGAIIYLQLRKGFQNPREGQALREEQVAWLAATDDRPAAIRAARAGLDAMPGDLAAMRRLSLELVEHGDAPAEVDEGVALVRRTIVIEPGNAYAHAALARGLVRQGRRDEALAEFARAVALDPASAALRAMRDEAHERLR